MSQRNIKPAKPGLIVRNPESGKPVAAQGEQVEWSAYWQRRWNEGDIAHAPARTQTKQQQPTVKQPRAATEKKGGAK